jgi:hypothetical protein
MHAPAQQIQPRATVPHQPGLIGIEPEPPVLETRIALCGQLRRRAELRLSPDGRHAHLVVDLAQPARGGQARPPIVAIRHGSAADVPAFEALARQLAPGVLVLVICRGMDWDAQRHELRAWRCDRIRPIPAADAAHFTADARLDAAGAAPSTTEHTS